MNQQEFKLQQYKRRRANTKKKALKLIERDYMLKNMTLEEKQKYLQFVWELKLLKINYEEFVARRYKTLKLQLPRVRQTELVNKIVRTWNGLHDRVKVSFRFPHFYGEPTDDQNSDTDQWRIINRLKEGGDLELNHKKKRVKVNKAMFVGHQSMLQFLDNSPKISKIEKFRKYPRYNKLVWAISEERQPQFDSKRYFQWKSEDSEFSSSQYEQSEEQKERPKLSLNIRDSLYFKEIQQMERQEIQTRKLFRYDAFRHKVYLKNLNQQKQKEQKKKLSELQEKIRNSMVRQFKQDEIGQEEEEEHEKEKMDEQIQELNDEMEEEVDIQQKNQKQARQIFEKMERIRQLSVVDKETVMKNEQFRKLISNYGPSQEQISIKNQSLFVQTKQEKLKNKIQIMKIQQITKRFRQTAKFQQQRREQDRFHNDQSSSESYISRCRSEELDKIEEFVKQNETDEEKQFRELVQFYKKIHYWSKSHLWMRVDPFHYDMKIEDLKNVTQSVLRNPSLHKEILDYCNPERNQLFMLNNDKIDTDAEGYLRNEQKWFIFKQNGRKYTVCRFCWVQFQIKDQITHWCGVGGYHPLKKQTKKFKGYISVSSDGRHTQRFQISTGTFTTKPPKITQGPQWTCVRHKTQLKTSEQKLKLEFIAQRASAFRRRPFCDFISSYPVDFAHQIFPQVNANIQKYEPVYNQPTKSTYDRKMTIQFKFQMRSGLIFGTIGGDIIPKGIIAEAFQIDEKYSLYPLSGATFLSFCQKSENPNCQILFGVMEGRVYGVLRTLRTINRYEPIQLK